MSPPNRLWVGSERYSVELMLIAGKADAMVRTPLRNSVRSIFGTARGAALAGRVAKVFASANARGGD